MKASEEGGILYISNGSSNNNIERNRETFLCLIRGLFLLCTIIIRLIKTKLVVFPYQNMQHSIIITNTFSWGTKDRQTPDYFPKLIELRNAILANSI